MALVSRASVSIDAPRKLVWATLMRRDTVLAILPVTEVILGFRVGEPFLWAFELGGRRSHIEGFVHRIDDPRRLEYEYGDPHTRDVLHSENVHHVTIDLVEQGGGTRVTVVQDGNLTAAAQAHAEGGWRLALNNLKHLVELGEHIRTSLG